jgi:hypothetical protein
MKTQKIWALIDDEKTEVTVKYNIEKLTMAKTPTTA